MGEPDPQLPTGTITFLFSDIEGSTEFVQRLDPPIYRDLLEQHNIGAAAYQKANPRGALLTRGRELRFESAWLAPFVEDS